MKKSILIFLTLLLIGTQGCGFFFKKPTLQKVHDVKIVSFGIDKTELEISISLKNPNGYKLKLDRLDIELLNKDRGKIGSAGLKSAVVIPKKRSNALNFRVILDTRPTAKMISTSNQKVFFYISGQGHGKVLGFGKKFDFEEPYELDMKKYLETLIPKFEAGGESIFKIKRSYIKKLGFTQADLSIDFILMNPFGLTFKFKGFPAEVFMGDKSVGKGNLATQMNFNENVTSKDGSMVFKINNWRALSAAFKGVFKGEIPYSVKGTLVIEAFGLQISKPYEYKGKIPINLTDLIF
jgi:LEA14-like dessication related protein